MRKKNKIEQAIELLEHAVAHDADCIQAHAELARIFCDQDNLAGASFHLTQALKNGIPENIDLAFSLSLAMTTVGKSTPNDSYT